MAIHSMSTELMCAGYGRKNLRNTYPLGGIYSTLYSTHQATETHKSTYSTQQLKLNSMDDVHEPA